MLLKQTKRYLKNLLNKYGDLLYKVKKDLRPYGHDACPYTGIDEKDKDFIYEAICNLADYVNNTDSPIFFDIQNVYVTEKKALQALTNLNFDIEKDGYKIKEIANKYLRKEGIDYYAIKHCLRYYGQIHNHLSEILDSDEVREFLNKSNKAHSSSNETTKRTKIIAPTFKFKEEDDELYERINDLFNILKENKFIKGTLSQFKFTFALISMKSNPKINWIGNYAELKYFINLVYPLLANSIIEKWKITVKCYSYRGEEFNHSDQVRTADVNEIKADRKKTLDNCYLIIKK